MTIIHISLNIRESRKESLAQPVPFEENQETCQHVTSACLCVCKITKRTPKVVSMSYIVALRVLGRTIDKGL